MRLQWPLGALGCQQGLCQALCEGQVVSSWLPAHHGVPTCGLPGLCSCTDAVTTLPQPSLDLAAVRECSGPNTGTALAIAASRTLEITSTSCPKPADATGVSQLLGCQLILGLVYTDPEIGQKLGSPSLAPLLPWEIQPASLQSTSPAVLLAGHELDPEQLSEQPGCRTLQCPGSSCCSVLNQVHTVTLGPGIYPQGRAWRSSGIMWTLAPLAQS